MSLSFSLATVATFILVFARISGFFVAAPLFSTAIMPIQLRIMLVMLLSLVATPVVAHNLHTAIPDGVFAIGVLVLKEIIVGISLGFVLQLVFLAVQMAGYLIDFTVGFSFASVLDPLGNFQASALAQLYYLASLLIFFVVGGHELMVAGLIKSFDLIPVTTMPHLATISGSLFTLFPGLFVSALQIAAPVMVAGLVSDFAVGLTSRAMSTANIFAVGIPLKIAVGLSTVWLSIPIFVIFFSDSLNAGLTNMSNFAVTLTH